MPCAECKLGYPDELLSPLMTSAGNTAPVCGICALKLSNEFHGANRKSFHGPIAESLRLRAVEWRRKRGIKV